MIYRWLNAFLKSIFSCIEWGLFALFVMLVLLTFTQVVLRYIFNSSLFWGDEVIFFLFTWLIFLSAAIGLVRGSHFSVDLVIQLFPERLEKCCRAFVQLSVGAILIFFCTVGLLFAAQAWPQESDILRLPMTWMYLALPIGAVLMLLVTARNIIAIFIDAPIDEEAGETR
jgi:TRAP-type C4-dicarboxylate transport system permease small subunit